MTKFLWTLLKFLLVLAIAAGLLVGAYYLSRYLGWPEWMALVLVGGLFALVVGGMFLRSLINRRREEGFIRQVVEQDESLLKGAPLMESRQLQEIEQRWQDALNAIGRSHLKKRGNPLYVLPWYLMIGEQSSGKTTVLRNSRLPASFPDVSHPQEDAPTRNVDWWFFDDCVVMDTAGRYAEPGAIQRSKEEWKKFIHLLAKHRRREPINGLIIALPADKLTKEAADYQEQYGQSMHILIEQLMRGLGSKFPIYIMVTKADQALGMNAFCHGLPWKAYRQAMGCINRDLNQDYMGFLDETMNTISERLKDLRLLILERQNQGDHNLMVFPEELPALRPGLAAFIRGAFQENPYQETPLLRGIFFSSGRQTGKVKSRSVAAMGVTTPVEDELPGTNRGLFLQDFLAQVLPADRHLPSPLKEFVKWSRSVRHLGMLTILAAALVVFGLMSFSFGKNLYAIESFRSKFVNPPTLQGAGKTAEDIILMNYFRKEVEGLEQLNRNWWLPRMGLEQSQIEEVKLKAIYRQMFEKGLLDPIDHEMQVRIAGFDKDTPDVVIGGYVEHLARRINLLKAYLGNESLENMAQMPQPSAAVVLLVDKTLLPAVAGEFKSLYLYYLQWSTNRNSLEIKKRELQTRLTGLLEIKGRNMEWLVAWANAESDLETVTSNQFWKDRLDETGQAKVKVLPAYTAKGKERIDDFIKQIGRALDDPDLDPRVVSDRKEVFTEWRQRQYIAAWADFGRGFIDEELALRADVEMSPRSRTQWRDLAVEMTTFQSPYFQVLDRMADEMAFLKGGKDTPSWVYLTVDFQSMKAQVLSQSFVGKGLSMAESAKDSVTTALQTQPTESTKALQSHMKAVEDLLVYQTALLATSPAIDSEFHAYQLAAQLFEENPDPAGGKSPFTEGFLAKKRLEALIGSGNASDDIFWDLLESPLNFLLYFTCRESACSLQSTWDEQVLSEVQGVPDEKMQAELFAEQGVVWNFLSGPAGPFLSRNERNFYSRVSYGEKVPFIPAFLDFLKEGARGRHMFKAEYEVRLEGFPTDVNEDAIEKPQSVTVEMICSNGLQKLENLNYPVSQVFKWSPEACGGLKLEISFRTFSLVKTYPNFSGFPYFLVDFRNGSKIFTPADFPVYKQELDKRHIERVRVRFEFAGQEPVIDLIERTPLIAPRKIVYCWK